jgi:hypothetical protein
LPADHGEAGDGRNAKREDALVPISSRYAIGYTLRATKALPGPTPIRILAW